MLYANLLFVKAYVDEYWNPHFHWMKGVGIHKSNTAGFRSVDMPVRVYLILDWEEINSLLHTYLTGSSTPAAPCHHGSPSHTSPPHTKLQSIPWNAVPFWFNNQHQNNIIQKTFTSITNKHSEPR
mmetsp:Transcript_21005/g.29462  ORF Transcript_21005/g.29462 Transcript_21005/m.29462 type:complete len:125 (+) Transcript_21005:1175-1549(+)